MSTLQIAGLKKSLAVESIVWIQANGNYARLYFTGSPYYLVSQTLNSFEQRLPTFLRIHKSILVNPDHLVRFDQSKAKQAQVIISTGQILDLARRRIEPVRVQLGMPSFDAQVFQLVINPLVDGLRTSG